MDYRASVAQWHAECRARRPKDAKLAVRVRLREYVQQMPAVLMVFLTISVILALAVAKLPRMRSSHWPVVAPVLVSMVYGPQDGNPQVTSFDDVALFAMADRSEFLYASDESSVEPEMGGVAATRMVPISLVKLEQQCDFLLSRYGAIIARSDSACLSRHRGEAATFVTADGFGSPGWPITPVTLWEQGRLGEREPKSRFVKHGDRGRQMLAAALLPGVDAYDFGAASRPDAPVRDHHQSCGMNQSPRFGAVAVRPRVRVHTG